MQHSPITVFVRHTNLNIHKWIVKDVTLLVCLIVQGMHISTMVYISIYSCIRRRIHNTAAACPWKLKVKSIECTLQLKIHRYQHEWVQSTMTCWLPKDSSSQWAGRLGYSASFLPPHPAPLLLAPPLLDLLWHCPLLLHGERQQPCFTGETGTAEGCCTTHPLSAQLCTSAVSCTSLHAPLHWLCSWTVTASAQVTGWLTAPSLWLDLRLRSAYS